MTSSSVALLSVGSTAGLAGDWVVTAAMTPGQVGSWFINGALTARRSSSHRYIGGLAYSAQRVNSTDLFAMSAISSGSRSVGRIYGFDEWIVSKYVSVGYGLSYMWQDYVATDGLVSPRVSLTVSPVNGLRLRALAARNSFAPGSEEFVNVFDNTPDGMWLPAHRSFSPWSERDGLHAQTTDHVEFGVERDVAAYVVGVRTFYQSVNDQAGAVFAAPSREHPAAGLGHYYLANLGDFDARGWGVKVSRPLFGAVRGSVDYSVTTAQWLSGPGGASAAWFGGADRAESTRVHDFTTSVETAIAQTSTHVYVLYKLNTGFAQSGPGVAAARLRRALRHPGQPGVAVHGVHLGRLGSPGGGVQSVPRCRRRTLRLRRTARHPPAQAHSRRSPGSLLSPADSRAVDAPGAENAAFLPRERPESLHATQTATPARSRARSQRIHLFGWAIRLNGFGAPPTNESCRK